MNLKYLFSTTVGKKQWVAITGLGLALFVLMHMAGNLLILVGPEAYNRYSHALVSNPLLYVAEAGLATLFLVHIALALSLHRLNRKARPVGSLPGPGAKDRASFASRTMIYSGLLLLAFLVLHLWTFKYGPYYPVTYGGAQMRDLHRLIVEKFTNPFYSAYYIFSLVVLGLHLSHGTAALFQTLGFSNVKHAPLRRAALGFAALVALGFISQPVYIWWKGGY